MDDMEEFFSLPVLNHSSSYTFAPAESMTSSFAIVQMPLPAKFSMQCAIKTMACKSDKLKRLLRPPNQNTVSGIYRSADLSIDDKHDAGWGISH